MNRCVVVLVLVAALLGLAVPAVAITPEGPRLAVVTHEPRYGSKLVTIGPAGETPQELITQPASDRPSWSADGSLLALAAVGPEWDGSVVGVARADGSGLRAYRRAFLNAGNDPVMSPDGRSVAFSRVNLVKVLPGRENYLFKSSIWLLDVKSGSVRRLTRWRLATYLSPSSFSPDGSTLATGMFSRQGFRAIAIDLSTGRLTLLAKEARDPTYSPDGSEVAFVRWKNWRSGARDDPSPPIYELRVVRVSAVTGTRLLLRRRSLLAWPSWDPSGSRLTFTSSHVVENGYSTPEVGNKVMAINADGTCLRKVFSDPGLTLYGSAWQPGPGREAGKISC
jgi:Tol biopolymer transport system component